MNWSDLLGILLLAVSGMFVGGAYTTWRQNRRAGVTLAVGATLAAVAGIAWLV